VAAAVAATGLLAMEMAPLRVVVRPDRRGQDRDGPAACVVAVAVAAHPDAVDQSHARASLGG